MRDLSKLLSILIIFFLPNSILAEEIGSVDTVFKLFGPDNKIVIEAFDDPDINNILNKLQDARQDRERGLLFVSSAG